MIYLVYTAYIDDEAESHLEEGLYYGWLSPDGRYYPCDYGMHLVVAGEIRE